MNMTRPVSLEPLHGSSSGSVQQVTIAPNLQPRKPGKPTGITIRTSRHWVLPPRPKPGRKPSPSLSIKQQIANVKIKQEVSHSVPTAAPEPVVEDLQKTSVAVPKKNVVHVRKQQSAPAIPLTTCKNGKQALVSRSKQMEQSLAPQVQQPKKPLAPKPQKSTKAVHPNATLPKKQNQSSVGMENSPVVKTELGSKATTGMEQLDVILDTLQLQSSDTKKKPATKTALKKEIKLLKMENNKLKQELTELVGNLHDLKRQFPIADEQKTISPTTTAMKQKIIPKPVSKTFYDSLHVKQEPSKHHEKLHRKRSIIDTDMEIQQVHIKQEEPTDDTEIFLKFDEDDEPNKDIMKHLTSSKMIPATSYGSRASYTDDDDLLLSSSTPSSLFSTDLSRTISNQVLSNSTTLPNTSSSPSSSHTSNKSLPNSQYSDTIEAMKFLDGYEQMEFYSKYKLSANHAQEPLKSVQKVKPDHVQSHQEELDCIKEEDLITDLQNNSKSSNSGQDPSTLYFLQKHALTKNPGSKFGDLPMDLDDSLPSSLLSKLGADDDDSAFLNLDLNNIDQDDPLGQSIDDTAFVAPTLEELMEEQDDKDSKLLGPENTEEGMDLLKMDIFFDDDS